MFNFIAKDGQKKVLYWLIAFFIFFLLGFTCLSILSFVISIFLIFIFRYKQINLNNLKEKNIYAPISGSISAIDSHEFKKQIYIDVSIFDLHNLRSLENNLVNTKVKRGLNLCLDSFKSKTLNEKVTFEYPNTNLSLLSSSFTNKLDFNFSKNLKKGDFLGTFLNGQVIVTLNEDLICEVNIGDKIRSGETIIASFKS